MLLRSAAPGPPLDRCRGSPRRSRLRLHIRGGPGIVAQPPHPSSGRPTRSAQRVDRRRPEDHAARSCETARGTRSPCVAPQTTEPGRRCSPHRQSRSTDLTETRHPARKAGVSSRAPEMFLGTEMRSSSFPRSAATDQPRPRVPIRAAARVRPPEARHLVKSFHVTGLNKEVIDLADAGTWRRRRDRDDRPRRSSVIYSVFSS